MRIAVYCCNFGNYRDELSTDIDSIFFDNNIDYYLFTDNNNIISNKWKIVKINLLDYLHILCDDIMEFSRIVTKYFKFILPDILKQYDIIVWSDSKLLKRPVFNNINKDSILELFENNKCKIINLKHPKRKTPHDELTYTIHEQKENNLSGTEFLKEITNIKYNLPLPETCLIIRLNETQTNEMMAYVFKLLKEKKLKRDQNVYNHAIYETGYSIENVKYLPFNFIYKNYVNM